MTISAGLLGYLGPSPSNERVAEAVRRAPWRGDVAASIEGIPGAIVALGSAQAGRYGPIATAVHGRIDNLNTLAADLDIAPLPDTDGVDPCLVLASAYLRWGETFAGHVLGDFAAIVFDARRGLILGTRDWIGARPLFWGRHGDTIAFASEVKQVLALLDRAYRIDEATLAEYEQFQSPALHATFAEGVSAVLPNGQVVAVPGNDSRVSRRALRFAPVDLSLPSAVDAVRDQLEIAVERRTAGAGRLGALISGGMDSTSVTAIAASRAARGIGPPLVAGLTLHFPDVPACDETQYARDVADHWQVPWKPVITRPAEALTWPRRGFALHDGPTFPNIFSVRNLIVAAQHARIDVLLAGTGGDHWVSQGGHEFASSLLRLDWRGIAGWGWHARRHPRSTARTVLRSAARRVRSGARAEQYFERRADDYWLRVGLESQEREGMRLGVRVEFPLCDIQVAALLAGLRPSLHSMPGTTKLILREAMRGLLPNSVLSRPDKTTFDALFVAAAEVEDTDVPILIQFTRRFGAAWRDMTGDDLGSQ